MLSGFQLQGQASEAFAGAFLCASCLLCPTWLLPSCPLPCAPVRRRSLGASRRMSSCFLAEGIPLSSLLTLKWRNSCDVRKKSKLCASTSWNKVLGAILLLAERFRECGYSSNDARGHENKGYDGPNNTPTLRRASILLGKDTGVGGIYFAKDEIVALFKNCGQHRRTGGVLRESHNIPDTIQGRHDAYEKLCKLLVLANLS